MKKQPFRPLPYLLLAAAAALVVAYNFWSYCCGRCRFEHFFTFGPAGIFLIFLAGTAAVILLALRRLRQRQEARRHCRCGTRIAPGWVYCPGCGNPAAPSC